MKTKFLNFLKIILANSLIILTFVALVEIFFGYWFDKDNFGPYMREHRMKNQKIIWNYKNEIVKYNYKRNYYGFRGDDIKPRDIKAIIMGGSVIDERYKPDQYTITGFLNQNLKKNDISLEIVNAGVEGQSTSGIISGFENWLFKMQDFKPKYILIYTGINDQANENDNILGSETDGHLLNPEKFEVFSDNFKSRSFIYDQLRIFKYKVLSNKKDFVKYDGKIDKSYKEKFNFISYQDADKIKDVDKKKVRSYLKRIDIINSYIRKINAKPIFITSITASGYNKKTLLLNSALIKHCSIKKYTCIDSARKLKGKVSYWYDGVHTTKEGSKAIADIITRELLNFFNLNQI